MVTGANQKRAKRTKGKRTQKAVANAAKIALKSDGDSLNSIRNRLGDVMSSERSAIYALICEREVEKHLCWRFFSNFFPMTLLLK